MKKTTPVVIILFLAAMSCFSQRLSLFYKGNLLDKNSVIVRTGTPDSLDLTTFLAIRNDAGTLKYIHEKKTEMTMVPGAAASICWANYCYPPGVDTSLNPLVLASGESKYSCFAHFTTTGIPGTSTILWTWFDRDNPTDSVSTVITYNTFPAGINEPGPGSSFTAFPNPARKEVAFRLNGQSAGTGSVIIRNSSGTIVFTGVIRDEIRVDVSRFPDGIYFTSVVSGKKVPSSLKLLISH